MKPNAHFVRDVMIRSYTESYRRAQIEMSPRDIEKQVIADCQLVDAARASGDLTNGKKDKKRPKKRANIVEKAQRETGTTLQVDAGRQVVKSRTFDANPLNISERWGAAAARIQRILEGVRKDTTSLVVAVEDAELGALATEYADLWAHFMQRYAPAPLTGKDRNPFRDLSSRDAARKFQRLVEDICDRSTSKLGPWYNGISATGFARNRG